MVEPVNDLNRYPPISGELLQNSRVLRDRWMGLALWPKQAAIAEIGVALGGFSRAILDTCQPKKFFAIDRFDLHHLDELWGVSTREHFGGRTHLDFYRHRFAHEIGQGQLHVLQGDSAEMVSTFEDASVDVFYVDADHGYEGVRRDLEALLPKVKQDGWIVMNDYIPADTFSNEPMGVIQATNEFMERYRWEMAYLALAPMMYCDVGLRKFGASGLNESWSSERIFVLESEMAELRRTHRETVRSISWRVTAPLRWGRRLFIRQR